MSISDLGRTKFTYISPLALVSLSACQFGTGEGGGVGTPVSGNIVKGPLSNALVFLDLDGDSILDENEQSIRTDANGGFTINTTATNYKIVALTDDTTVDASSGAVLSGVKLTAPKGAAVVTPTTTLMEEGGLTAEQVAEVLQLPDGVDPLTFNPFAAGVDATKALEVEKVSQQIMTAVSSFASAAEGAGASESGAFTAALSSVVEVVKVKAEKLADPSAAAADKKIDFTNASDLNAIRDKVADETQKIATAEGTSDFDKGALTRLVNDTTTSIKNVNDQIKTVTDLSSDAAKNIFSTTQVLAEQVKTAAIAEKASQGSGSISFTNPLTVKSAADNFAPKDLKLSATSIMEGSKELVVGSLSTIDPDQTSGFKYEIVTAKGTDYSKFSINNKGELVLNGTPDYSKQSLYKLFVTTTDTGGKKFSKELEINVEPDPHQNFLVKFKVKYIEEGDVGKEYNTALAQSKAAYEAFLGHVFSNTNALDSAIDTVFKGSVSGPSSSSGGHATGGGGSAHITGGTSSASPPYQQLFQALPSNARPIIAESGETFSVTYPVANSDDWKMTIKVKGYTADSSNAYGGKDGAGKTIDFFDPMTWTVSGGLESIDIFKGSTKALSVTVSSTAMQIKGEAAFASNFQNGDVGAVSLQGDFSKTNADDFFAILDQLSVNPSATPTSSSSGDPFASSYTPPSGVTANGGANSTTTLVEQTVGVHTTSSTHTHGGSNNYTISKVLVYGKDSSKTNGLTDNPVAESEIAKGSLSLTLGDYKMSLVSQQLPDYITAGDLFDFATVDLLDVEEIIKDGVDGLFTLNHKTHGDLVIIESDMSSAQGSTTVLGANETFGSYNGQRFVSDSNDVVAAYFDFGDAVVTDAQFEAYWSKIDGITDMFVDIV